MHVSKHYDKNKNHCYQDLNVLDVIIKYSIKIFEC